MKRRIRIQGMLIALTMITVFLLYKILFPHWKNEKLDEFLDALGIFFVLIGFLFRISARGHKEENSSRGKALVTDGPYAIMRNPMYFGTLMIGTGFITVLVEWWALLVFLSVFFLIYRPQVKNEEAALTARFGQTYLDYCKETPRYFPKLKRFVFPQKYLFLRPSWLKKELPSLLAAATCMVAIETWEDIMLFGKQELFKELLELCFTIAVLVLAIGLLYRVKIREQNY